MQPGRLVGLDATAWWKRHAAMRTPLSGGEHVDKLPNGTAFTFPTAASRWRRTIRDSDAVRHPRLRFDTVSDDGTGPTVGRTLRARLDDCRRIRGRDLHAKMQGPVGRSPGPLTAEHGVDMDTGAIVAVTVQDASDGDTATLPETLIMAAEQVEAVQPAGAGVEEVVADKGYHSDATLVALDTIGVRSHVSEPERGRRCWRECARLTGGGWPVRVRQEEGVTNHLHPESCAGRCEAAGEALTGARTGRAIEHRKNRGSGAPRLFLRSKATPTSPRR